MVAPFAGSAAQPVSFDRHVRPILTANCYQCHGPDADRARLRLDRETDATPALKEVLARISHSDPEEIMPPIKSGKKLTDSEIATLHIWIAQGAKWEQHWSVKPLRRPATEAAFAAGGLGARAVDLFIRAKQSEIGVAPSAEADNRTLIRRMTLTSPARRPRPRRSRRLKRRRNQSR